MGRGAKARQRRTTRRAAGRSGQQGASRALALAPQAVSDEDAAELRRLAASVDEIEEVEVVAATFAPEVIDEALAVLVPDTHSERLRTFVKERLESAFGFAVTDVVLVPPELEPAETLPAPGSPSPPAPAAVAPPSGTSIRWRAVLAPEGRLTDDGRAFAPGSITWRELPLTLMAMVVNSEGGHVGAEICGRIDRIWRDEAIGLIRAEGVFDEGDFGLEIARLVADLTLRGNSVDLAIHEYEVGPRSDWFDDDGNWAPRERSEDEAEQTVAEILFGEEPEEPTIFVVTNAVIGMSTVCPFPAFADATIEVANSLVAGANPAMWTVTMDGGFTLESVPKTHPGYGEPPGEGIEHPADGTLSPESGDVLTAAAAGLAPVSPPREWFDPPNLTELTPLVVTAEGQIYGHAWAWETCHLGFADECVTAPVSEAGYAYYHLKEIECEDGSRVSCGTITLDAPHADRRLGRVDATAHYDNTGMAAADVVVGEDEYGGWVAGALRPDITAEKARALRGAVLSGDWRNVNGNLELVALLAVNVPGFPVPRPRALVAAGDGEPEVLVLALVAAGIHAGATGEHALDRAVSADVAAKLKALHDQASGRYAELAAQAG